MTELAFDVTTVALVDTVTQQLTLDPLVACLPLIGGV
jgi:hypothetical protein